MCAHANCNEQTTNICIFLYIYMRVSVYFFYLENKNKGIKQIGDAAFCFLLLSIKDFPLKKKRVLILSNTIKFSKAIII
jgi:hypothetical protein